MSVLRSAPVLRTLVAALLCLCAFGVTEAGASHYRYGTMYWEKDLSYTGPGYKVRVTLSLGYRWSFPWQDLVVTSGPGWTGCPNSVLSAAQAQGLEVGRNNCPPLHSYVPIEGAGPGYIRFERPVTSVTVRTGYPTNQSIPVEFNSNPGSDPADPYPAGIPGPYYVEPYGKVIEINPAQDVMYVELSLDVVFPASSNPLAISHKQGNRLSSLVDGNEDLPYHLRAVVDAALTTRSARSASVPDLSVTRDVNNPILIATSTFDNTTTRLQFASLQDSGLTRASPLNMSIDPLTPTLVNFFPRSAPAASLNPLGQYAVQFRVQSVNAAGIVTSDVPLDLLFTVKPPCATCPVVTVATPLTSTSLQATVDQPLVAPVDVFVSPFTNGSTLSFAHTPLPAGMTLETTSATVNPMRGTLRWTPTADSPENNVVCFQGVVELPHASASLQSNGMLCFNIHVNNPFDLAPVVSCSATPIEALAASPAGANVVLSATVSEPERQATNVTWSEGTAVLGTSSTAAGAVSATVQLLTTVFSIGTHAVVATANDGKKAGSCTTTIIVNKRPQTLTFTGSVAPLKVTQARPLTATASSGLTPVLFSLPPGSKGQINTIAGVPNLIAMGVPFVEVTLTQAGDTLWAPASLTIQIETFDGNPPVIAVPPNVTVEATGPGGATVNYITAHQPPPAGIPPPANPPPPFPFAFDDVDGFIAVSCAPVSGSVFPVGATTVRCNATDAAGNVAMERTFTVTVRDTTAPTIESHADVTVEATGPTGAPAGYDPPVTHDLVDGDKTATCSPAPNTTFAKGETVVTCTATDVAGNHAVETTFKVFVVDSTPPTIAAHDTVTAEATGPNGATVAYTAPATLDLVDGAGRASCLPVAGTLFARGETLVTCKASDAAGNHAVDTTFKVFVVDATPPVIAAHDDVIAEAGTNGAVVTYVAPATSDVVDLAGTATCSPASGSNFAKGDTTVTCSAMDAAGNHAISTTFKVKVLDTLAPTIDAVTDITVEAGANGAVVNYAVPASHDGAEGDKPATCSPASGSSFPSGETMVTCTATDAAGNAATPRTFKVFLVDTVPPVIAPHDNVTVEATSAGLTTVTYSAPATTDAVDGAGTAICSPTSGLALARGTHIITCRASDRAGNVALTTSFTLVVADTTPPTVDARADIEVASTSPAGAVVTYTSPASHDAVAGDNVSTCSPASGSTFSPGVTTVRCTAGDAAGNVGARTFKVTVTNNAPTFTPPANITVNATNAAGAVVTFTANGADVEQGSIPAVCAPPSGSTFAIGVTTVPCTVTDVGGLSASGSFTVTVVVTNASVQGAVIEFLGTGNEANGLLTKLKSAASAPNANARAGQLNAFVNQVNAKIGKTLTAAQAAILIQMAQSLF